MELCTLIGQCTNFVNVKLAIYFENHTKNSGSILLNHLNFSHLANRRQPLKKLQKEATNCVHVSETKERVIHNYIQKACED